MTQISLDLFLSESDDEQFVNQSFNLKIFKNKKTNIDMDRKYTEQNDKDAFNYHLEPKTFKYFYQNHKNQNLSMGENSHFNCIKENEDILKTGLRLNKFNHENRHKENFNKNKIFTDAENHRNKSQTHLGKREQNSIFHFLKPINTNWTIQKIKNKIGMKKIENNSLKRSFSLPTHDILSKYEHNIVDFWNNLDNGVKFSLPISCFGASDSLPRILPEILSNILNNMDIDLQLIDCRFEYEYYGGHILNAINIDNTDLLKKNIEQLKNKILVFYCEFSSVRAPRIAKYLRNYDRFNNMYPQLDFPEIYVLEGGYKKFFELYSNLCIPNNYIRMNV